MHGPVVPASTTDLSSCSDLSWKVMNSRGGASLLLDRLGRYNQLCSDMCQCSQQCAHAVHNAGSCMGDCQDCIGCITLYLVDLGP